jgi:hypothetical protein
LAAERTGRFDGAGSGGAAAALGGAGFGDMGLMKAGLSGAEAAGGAADKGGGIGAVATGSALAAAQEGADSNPTSAAVRMSPERLAMREIHQLARRNCSDYSSARAQNLPGPPTTVFRASG